MIERCILYLNMNFNQLLDFTSEDVKERGEKII